MFCPQDPIRETAEEIACLHEFLGTVGAPITVRDVLEWVAENYQPENVFGDRELMLWANSNDYYADRSAYPYF